MATRNRTNASFFSDLPLCLLTQNLFGPAPLGLIFKCIYLLPRRFRRRASTADITVAESKVEDPHVVVPYASYIYQYLRLIEVEPKRSQIGFFIFVLLICDATTGSAAAYANPTWQQNPGQAKLSMLVVDNNHTGVNRDAHVSIGMRWLLIGRIFVGAS